MSSRTRMPTGAGAPAGAAGAAPDPFLARLEDRLGQGQGHGQGQPPSDGEGEDALTNVRPPENGAKPRTSAPPLPKPTPMRSVQRAGSSRGSAPPGVRAPGVVTQRPPGRPPHPPMVAPPPPVRRAQSEVLAVPENGPPTAREGDLPPESSYADMPAVAASADNPFEAFEDDLEGESTRIDTQHLIAEQTTNILEDAPEPPYLLVESGKDLGKQFVLNVGETSVGRSIDNDVILTDIAVSRRHVRLLREGNELRLRDLGSGNGTTLNGKRVHESVVTEGDRIEIGETCLMVKVPVPAPAKHGQHGQLSGVPTVVVPPDEDTPHTDESHPPSAFASPPMGGYQQPTAFVSGPGGPVSSTQYISRGRDPTTAGVVIPKRMLLLGGIAAGGLLLITLIVILAVSLGGDDTPEMGTGPADLALAQGMAAFQAKSWDEAETHFNQAAAQGDPRGASWIAQVRAAREHAAVIASARTLLAQGNPNGALTQLAAIPPTSPYAPEAAALRQQTLPAIPPGAPQQQLAVAQVPALPQAPAVQPVAPVPALPPPQVREPQQREAQPQREAPQRQAPQRDPPRRDPPPRQPPTRSRPEPQPEPQPQRPVRVAAGGADATSRVLNAYRQANFDAAATIARNAAQSAPSSERQRLTMMADRIQRFGGYYSRIRRAGNNASSVQRELQSAITLDQQIVPGGHYSRDMRAALLGSYLDQARSQIRSNTSAACQAVRGALRVDGSNAQARQLAGTCEQRAGELVAQAQRAERTNPAQARGLYQSAMNLVPPQSATHRTAQQRLAALPRTAQLDEDE